MIFTMRWRGSQSVAVGFVFVVGALVPACGGRAVDDINDRSGLGEGESGGSAGKGSTSGSGSGGTTSSGGTSTGSGNASAQGGASMSNPGTPDPPPSAGGAWMGTGGMTSAG